MKKIIEKGINESCKLSCEIANKWSKKPFESEMILDYRSCIEKVMQTFFGIENISIINEFIDGCGLGNWEHMWLTEKEEKKTIDEWADALWGEVFYCSDRWSWDRLIRTNWIFQRVNTLYEAGKKSYAELLAK